MAVDAVDAAIKSGDLSPEHPSSTEGLILDGGYHWTPNHYIKLAQDFGKLLRMSFNRIYSTVLFPPAVLLFT